MEWILNPLKRTLDFSSRSTRMEYWIFTFFLWIACFIILLIDSRVSRDGPMLTGVFALLIALPYFALTVRRLHDMGQPGWWALLYFTGYGFLIVMAYALLGSQEGVNKYGPNPKEVNKSMRGKVYPQSAPTRQGGNTTTSPMNNTRMTSCASCGRELNDSDKFCAICGTPAKTV